MDKVCSQKECIVEELKNKIKKLEEKIYILRKPMFMTIEHNKNKFKTIKHEYLPKEIVYENKILAEVYSEKIKAYQEALIMILENNF